MQKSIIMGTRGSDLARWQTEYVLQLLTDAMPEIRAEIKILTTKGDTILDTPLPLVGGKGLFTAELESALHDGRIDFAVHSLKDLPTESPCGLTIGAILKRAGSADVLISRAGYTLDTLPNGAAIGTSSRRRTAQLLYHRPDLHVLDIRGNVDTRIRKALKADGPYDAILLARAGLERLGLLHVISQTLTFDQMLPAPGQGALAVQCRDEKESINLLMVIHHLETALAVTAERAFLAGLGGGCSVPIGAYAQFDGSQLFLRGRVSAVDGSTQIDVNITKTINPVAEEARQIGIELAQQALAQGAAALLEAV